MAEFHKDMNEYKMLLQKGSIQKAYRGLMEYFGSLRLIFKDKYPEYDVSGNIYQGFMDMTYFAVFPTSLKHRKLKIAVVFLHEAFRFEVWLVGFNKSIQKKYWNLVKDEQWNTYHIPSMLKGKDSIIEYVLVENPDFSNLDSLTQKIEIGILEFIKEVVSFLSKIKKIT